jgi:RnfABCDGE-type electron transport complex G subunit
MIRNIVRFVLVLGLVAVVIGGGVAVLYGAFEARISRQADEQKAGALRAVVPEGAELDIDHPLAGERLADDAVYVARAGGDPVAYVASGAAQGYSSTVKVTVGVRPEDFRIERVNVYEQQETPGLGATVAETKSTYTLWEKAFGGEKPEENLNPFLDRFGGKRVEDLDEIQAITSATITSNATKEAVREAVARIRKAVEKADG